MLGSGLYRAAWLGAAGGLQMVTATSVNVGVSRGLFPQVAIHQGSRCRVGLREENLAHANVVDQMMIVVRHVHSIQ